ncbi:hypothetical protein D9M70_624140 [compost metagenome]
MVFGAKRQIVGDFVRHDRPDAEFSGMKAPFYTCHYDFKLVPGTPTYPIPPISGKKA